MVAGVVAAPSLAQADPVRSGLEQAGLLPRRAAFTELSIKQYDVLFQTVTFEGDVHFDVLATNNSTRTQHYTWSATVGPQQAAIRVDGGRLTLAGAVTKEIPLHFAIPDCLVRNKITFRLAAKGQRSPEIHYWVLPRGSAAWKISGGPSCGA